MNEPKSPDLRNHAIELTEILQDLMGAESLHAGTVGAVMRGIRTGIERVSLSIAQDPNMTFEEAGRVLRSLSLIHKAIAEALAPMGMPAARKMKPLKRV